MGIERQDSGRYYVTKRRNQSRNTFMMGLEWEVPVISNVKVPDLPSDYRRIVRSNCTCGSCLERYNRHGETPIRGSLTFPPNNYTALQQSLPEHMLNNSDGGGLEVKTPIDNLGQQKRWAKSLMKTVGDLPNKHPTTGLTIKEWDHGAGIHVHISWPERNPQLPEKIRTLLHQCMGETVFLRMSHRGESYRGRIDGVNFSRRNNHGYTHMEYRMFNSHPKLLLPALEFTHSTVSYVLSGNNTDYSKEAFMGYLKSKKKYRNIYQLLVQVYDGTFGYQGRPLWERGKVVH